MAKRAVKPPPPETKAVTLERAARLYRLLKLLSDGPQTRATLLRRLRLDIRGFYRDLELLRIYRIDVPLMNRRYVLQQQSKLAIARLPFPDPHLTLQEAADLAKGRTAVHKKLKLQLAKIIR